MTYNNLLRKNTFRSWFWAVTLFYDFTLFPVVLAWFASAGTEPLLVFTGLWITVSLCIAWSTSRFVIFVVERENRHQSFVAQIENMKNAAEFALKLIRHTNPFGLAYTSCLLISRELKEPLLRGGFLLYAYASLAREYVSLIWKSASLARENLSPSGKDSME